MGNDNPYSKYRFDNSRSVKIRTGICNDKVKDVFGIAIKPISDSIKTKLYNTKSGPYGVKTIVNYIYTVERINIADMSITPSTYKGPTYFKPF